MSNSAAFSARKLLIMTFPSAVDMMEALENVEFPIISSPGLRLLMDESFLTTRSSLVALFKMTGVN